VSWIPVADSVGPHAFLTLRSGLIAFDPAAPAVGRRDQRMRGQSRDGNRTIGGWSLLAVVASRLHLGLARPPGSRVPCVGGIHRRHIWVQFLSLPDHDPSDTHTLWVCSGSDSDGAGVGLGAAAAIAAAAAAAVGGGTNEAERRWLSGPGVIIGHSCSSGRRRGERERREGQRTRRIHSDG
jgi:hypothetical protein